MKYFIDILPYFEMLSRLREISFHAVRCGSGGPCRRAFRKKARRGQPAHGTLLVTPLSVKPPYRSHST